MKEIGKKLEQDLQVLTQLLEENKEMNDKFYERMIEGLKDVSNLEK